MPMIRGESYFISAGEYSGDLLAAELVSALRNVMPKFKPFGICGDAMIKAGVDKLIHQEKLEVMGVVEVVKKIGEIKMVESFILQKISDRKPAFAILVDYPAFHFRLAEQLKLRGIPVVQYVAPKVWAWGQGRVNNLRRDFDLVLGVLPFEEAFFREHGVNYQLVGSPHKDRISETRSGASASKGGSRKPIIGLLPGSRHAELERIFPRMLEVKSLVQRKMPEAQFVMPLAPNLGRSGFCAALSVSEAHLPRPDSEGNFVYQGIRIVNGQSLEIMANADVVLVASGTATLECALLKTPMAVVYVMNDFSYSMAKRKVRIPYISLVNLLAGKEVVKEFIQNFSADEVAEEVVSLAQPTPRRQQMVEELEQIDRNLQPNASVTAAKAIATHFAISAS